MKVTNHNYSMGTVVIFWHVAQCSHVVALFIIHNALHLPITCGILDVFLLCSSPCLAISTALWYNSIRLFFLAGNSVFWREIPSVNIVSIASYKMNHNAAIRKQMWFIFLIAIDYTFTNPMIHFSLK